jgi:mono/diheme cytochrome c family protein
MTLRCAMMLMLLLASCDDMRRDGRIKPYEAAATAAGGASPGAQVSGTVARGQLNELLPASHREQFPIPVDRELLLRGRVQFNIYCSVCHGADGYGRGIVVQRGFTPPPSFHTERLRRSAPSHYYDVISDGYGAMYSYAGRVQPRDRWAIIAYIRALQLSQFAKLDKLSMELRARALEEEKR